MDVSEKLTQKGDWTILRFSTTTLVAFPTVRGIGRAKVVEEPPATPEFCEAMNVITWHSYESKLSAHLTRSVRVPPLVTQNG